MANLTKEQRLQREAEKEARLKAEIEEKVKNELEEKLKAELEEKLRAEYEEKLSNVNATNLNDDNVPNATERENIKPSRITKKIPLDLEVSVICNVQGGASYSSKRVNGYVVEWDEFGSLAYMELAELVAMRNSDRRFFEDNWIVFEDTDEYTAIELYNFLRVSKYYEKFYTPETIDSIFELEPASIISVLSNLSNGMKNTIASRAKIKIDAKEIDSNKKITALETALKVNFSI